MALAPAPGAAPMAPPASPIGGPSGPGASPMVSPGTGSGLQAQAVKKLEGIIRNLLEIGASFPVGGAHFNSITRAITALNSALAAEKKEPEPKPLPLPTGPPAGGAPGMGARPPMGMPGPGMPPGGPPISPMGGA